LCEMLKTILREIEQKKGDKKRNVGKKVQKPVKKQFNNDNHNIASRNYGIQVYDLEGKKSLEQMLRTSNLKARYNQEAKNYTNLIDDLELPIATNCVRLTGDENHLWATGVYPPQVRCFMLSEFTIKFKRHLDSEAIRLVPLTTDYRKLAILEVNRVVELHAQWGKYDKFRIPREGRDMAYHAATCELLICGSSNELYRFDLEAGIFRKPIESASETSAANVIRVNPIHQLWAMGCENGFVECIDPRSRKIAGLTDACDHINKFVRNSLTLSRQVRRLEYDPSNGVTMAVGTDVGHVALFDLRKSGCVTVKDHRYESPIVALQFHDLTKNVISADERIVKIWDRESCDTLVNLELPTPITDCLAIPNSGMIMVAGERAKIKPYYIPTLGPAPKWCSFVDNVTEELDEIKKFSVHQDFKFLTVDEIVNLNLQDLFGTDMLRPHMHGYFIKMNLYKKALDQQQQQQVINDQDIENQAESRLNANRINKEDAVKSLSSDESLKIKSVDDSRFQALMEDPDFAFDNKEQNRKRKQRQKQELKFKTGEENDDDEDEQDDQDDESHDGLYPLQSSKAMSFTSSAAGSTTTRTLAKDKKRSFAERLKGSNEEEEGQEEEEDVVDRKRFKANNRRSVGNMFKKK
jgi:ribosome biogenesis protein ENP2